MSTCRSCGKPVVWAKVRITGSPLPLDPEPSPNGNIRLLDKPEVEVLTTPQIAAAKKADEPLYLTHFATCKDAEKWRHNTHTGPRRKEDHD